MPPRKKKSEGVETSTPESAPTTPDMTPRDMRAAAMMEYVQKKMKGRAMLKRASEYELPYLTKRLPTGLLSLDLELGGGAPAGGLTQIVGAKNAGKSYLTWQIIRQQQFFRGKKLKVLLAMTEMRADRGQARKAGVQIALGKEDIDNIDRARRDQGMAPLSEQEILELQTEIGDIHELHGESAEDLYDGILYAVENNVYHLIIIDSFGSIVSGAEAESESLSEKQYAGASAVNTKFLRKLGALLTMDDPDGKARDVCVIGINQIRDAIGDPNKEYRTTGGRMLEHFKFIDLYLEGKGKIGIEQPMMTPQGTKKRFIATGKEVGWKIEKGKAGIHEGATGSYIFDFRIAQADFYTDAYVAGIREGIIEQAGAWNRLPNPETPGAYLINEMGKDKFVQKLIENPEFINHIRAECFKKRGIVVNYDWE